MGKVLTLKLSLLSFYFRRWASFFVLAEHVYVKRKEKLCKHKKNAFIFGFVFIKVRLQMDSHSCKNNFLAK